jgi:hypothetical protein
MSNQPSNNLSPVGWQSLHAARQLSRLHTSSEAMVKCRKRQSSRHWLHWLTFVPQEAADGVETLTVWYRSLLYCLRRAVINYIKPATDGVAAGLLAGVACSKMDLVAENAFLRQQLVVLLHSTNPRCQPLVSECC